MAQQCETLTKQSVPLRIDVNKAEHRTVQSLLCGSLVTPLDNPGITHLKYFDE